MVTWPWTNNCIKLLTTLTVTRDAKFKHLQIFKHLKNCNLSKLHWILTLHCNCYFLNCYCSVCRTLRPLSTQHSCTQSSYTKCWLTSYSTCAELAGLTPQLTSTHRSRGKPFQLLATQYQVVAVDVTEHSELTLRTSTRYECSNISVSSGLCECNIILAWNRLASTGGATILCLAYPRFRQTE